MRGARGHAGDSHEPFAPHPALWASSASELARHGGGSIAYSVSRSQYESAGLGQPGHAGRGQPGHSPVRGQMGRESGEAGEAGEADTNQGRGASRRQAVGLEDWNPQQRASQQHLQEKMLEASKQRRRAAKSSHERLAAQTPAQTENRVRNLQGSPPEAAVGWIVRTIKEMPHAWLTWDDSHSQPIPRSNSGNSNGRSQDVNAWLSTRVDKLDTVLGLMPGKPLSPPSRQKLAPALSASVDASRDSARTESAREAETAVHVNGSSNRKSPLSFAALPSPSSAGRALGPKAAELGQTSAGRTIGTSAQSPAPIPPSRTHSSDYSGKSGHNSAGGSGDSSGGGFDSQMPQTPARTVSKLGRAFSASGRSVCEQCHSEDSFARDKCQICGHERCRPPAVGMPSRYLLKLNCNL